MNPEFPGKKMFNMINNISTKIHPGALKYYKEKGVKISSHHN